MRRWNGWGEEDTSVPVPPGVQALLRLALGPAGAPHDVTFADVCRGVPRSRLSPHPLIDTDPAARARHARGQGLPDLIALRGGTGLVFPDGVAQPATEADVAALIALAAERAWSVIAYGGGTSVTGHVNPRAGDSPVLTVSLARLTRLRGFDPESRLATFEAGVAGPALEQHLGALGYRLGHYPQSFEYSSLGGWIATRSSGQQSRGYGRIEDLFAGGTVLTPAGTLRLAPFPASAAGPDLRHVVLGSEGRIGIVTEATVRVSPLPAVERFEALFFADWDAALTAVRGLAQSDLALSMIRLSTPAETATNLAMAGPSRAAAILDAVLRWRGARAPARCMAVVGFSGAANQVKPARRAALDLLRRGGAVRVGASTLGRAWQKGRFRAPYLRNTLWEAGYAVDTVETATTWNRVPRTLAAVEGALEEALAGEGERVLAFTHLSHVYTTGASLYTTFLFRAAADPEVTLARWRRLKAAASEAIVREGGTISHQHGVGADHAPYLAAEKGPVGMHALGRLLTAFDEREMLNPGKLLVREPEA
jgi:alkyldihydroxyacetonephosphate synthase